MLHIVPTLARGGTEQLLRAVLPKLDPERFRVSVCCSHDYGDARQHDVLRSSGIITTALPTSASRWKRLLGMAAYLRANPCHIVHIHCYDGNEIWARLAAVIARVPIIMTYDHDIHWNWTGWRGQAAWTLLNRRTAFNVAVSEQCGRYRTACCGGQTRKVISIVNGIDLSAFHSGLRDRSGGARRDLGIPPGHSVVGAIGRLVPWKRFDLFVRSMPIIAATLPRTVFIIRGEGPLDPELRALAGSLGVGDLRFVRWLPNATEIYSLLDVLVVTSGKEEGFGLVLAEAMASGVPVVGMANNPTHKEVLGASALLAEDNPEDIARQVVTTLTEVGPTALRVSAARQRVEARFDVRRTVNDLERLYLRAVAESKIGRN